ncbi:MAG: CBS and ACT domain-containing protein, partial [Peptococcaceae bacterium]|nr:CBS and ACT domain-containing protein [Peptococcaceae bacterium]
HVPIVKDGKLVGIVSDRDLRDACPSCLDSSECDVLHSTPVSKIMQTKVFTVHPLDFFDEALRLIYEHNIGCLPVISNGKLVGMIAEKDMLHHLVNMFGLLAKGSYVEVDIPDKPGVLAEITQIIKNHEVNLSSVMLSPTDGEGRKKLVLRIEALNITKILEEIVTAGYRIIWPSPNGG